jgi:poly-gamma-glutamate capsule biosynthesis protein CapA/YwtB (metallophosphatase superfamily)
MRNNLAGGIIERVGTRNIRDASKASPREENDLRRAVNHRLKRQQAKRQAIFLFIACLSIALLVTLTFAITPSNSSENVEVKREKPSGDENTQQSREAVAGMRVENAPSFSLGLGGDVCFGLDVADVISAEGPGIVWTEITHVLEDYDLTVVNLEGPLCRGGEPNRDQPSFNVKGDTSCVVPMAEAGVDAVCLANDHIMDYGAKGLEETLNILHGQGLQAVGAGSSKRLAQQPLIMESESGAQLAILSFCDVAPPSYDAGEDAPGISACDPLEVSDLVAEAVTESPYVVVYFHWGEVASELVSDRQRELAHAAVQAGADLVVGCHPHLAQGIEIWEEVPIIYSLGNLVFCAQSEEGKNGLFAGCRFGAGRITSLEIIPLRIERASPAPLAGAQAEEVLRKLASQSPGVDLMIHPQTGSAYLDL